MLFDKSKEIKQELDDIYELKSNLGRILMSLRDEMDSDGTIQIESGQIVPFDVISGDTKTVFTGLRKYISNAKKSVFFMGDFSIFKEGITHGVSNVVEHLITQNIEVSQIVCLSNKHCSEEHLMDLEMLDKRDKILKHRDTSYYLSNLSLNLSIVIIDQIIAGFAIKNPLAQNYTLSFYIESNRLVAELGKFFKSINDRLYKQIDDISQVHELLEK